MNKISASDAVQFGIDFVKRHTGFSVVSGLLLAVSCFPLFLPLHPLLIVNFFRCVREESMNGQAPSLGKLFRFDVIVPAIVVAFWGTFLIIFGLCMCVVPGLVLLPVPFLALVTLSFDSQSGLRALTSAIRVVERDPIGLVLACVLLIIVALCGIALLGVGMAITIPIMLVGMYRVAEQVLKPQEQAIVA